MFVDLFFLFDLYSYQFIAQKFSKFFLILNEFIDVFYFSFLNDIVNNERENSKFDFDKYFLIVKKKIMFVKLLITKLISNSTIKSKFIQSF